MFGRGDVSVYEVKAFTEDFRSWFIGQTVQRGKFTLPIHQVTFDRGFVMFR